MPISAAQELKFIQRIQERDDGQALVALAREHVEPLAKRMHRMRSDLELDDLVQASTIALWKAILRFDLNRDVRLTTFVRPRIWGALCNFAWRDNPPDGIKIPRQLREHAQRVMRIQDQFIQRLQRKPTSVEMAQKLGLSVEQVEEAIDVLAFTVSSLDELMKTTGEDAVSLMGREGGPERDVVDRITLYKALGEIRTDWRRVVIDHLLLGRTFQEIAADMNQLEGTVKVWCHRAIIKLRELLCIDDDNRDGGEKDV